MKIYNVNIYTVDHEYIPGTLTHRGHGLVKVNMFGAREIVTNTKLKICNESFPENNINTRIYKKNGYVLAVEKSELTKKHLATMDEINSYFEKWEKSDLHNYFRKLKILPEEEFKKVNEKVKMLAKM